MARANMGALAKGPMWVGVSVLLLAAACTAEASNMNWSSGLDRAVHDLHLAAVQVGRYGGDLLRLELSMI